MRGYLRSRAILSKLRHPDFFRIPLGQTRDLLLVLRRMKTHIILKGFAALLLFSPLAAMADDSPLAKQMEALDDAFKGFRKEKDAAKGAAQAREAQQALIRGFGETPLMLTKMPDGPEKETAAAQFRVMMAAVLVKLCEAEHKFLTGDMAGIEKIVADLKDLRKQGHDKFMEDEE
jgi:soluble cytochrome b562